MAVPTAMTPIRIRLLWHPQAQFAGYLLAEQKELAAPEVVITCVPMRSDRGPIEALRAGDVEFTVASPAHMLESGVADDLVFLLAIQQTSALIYPARCSAGIEALPQLAGHRIGVWPGREDLEIRWMLHRAGVDLATIEFVPQNDTVTGLVDRVTDCAQMTTYHEIHHLEHMAGSLDDFTLFRAADHGAALLKDGLIARRDWVTAHPAETQAVIDAVLEGWTMAFRTADLAVAACVAARPDMSKAEHERQLGDIRDLALTGATLTEGLGYPNPAHLRRAAEAMAAVHGGLPGAGPSHTEDLRFWSAAPAVFRSASW